MCKFLRNTLSAGEKGKYQEELRELETRVKRIVKACRCCADFEPRAKRGTAVPEELKFGERGWADMFKLSDEAGGETVWGQTVVDEATGDLALAVLRDGTGLAAFEAYFLRWASVRGHFEQMLSDAGGSYIAKEFLAECDGSKGGVTECGG